MTHCSSTTCRPGRHAADAQRGSVAVSVAAMLFVMLGVCGMAIDLSMMYNRRVELQNLAEAVATAAAAKLDRTAQGVAGAMASAADIAQRHRYRYGLPVSWNNAALQFSTTPSRTGDWLAADMAKASPGGRLYARVDTTALDAATGVVESVFMNALGQNHDASMHGFAIAGRTAVRVMPLAVCALAPAPAASRTIGSLNELVEFGFRRGVAYDLMQLNPDGLTPENFVVNPFAPPGTPGTAGPTSPSVVGPYVCNGTMSMARVTGGQITVARPFPLAALVNHLNARFDQYAGNACTRAAAPPDFNIKAYPYASIGWMTTVPLAQSAAAVAANGKLRTVADVDPTPAGTAAGKFGPLWAFAKAVPFSSYVAGTAEPAAGYTAFSANAWTNLYNPGQPVAKSYPSTPPYQSASGTNFLAPSSRGLRNRRVLNVPLLSCPVSSGSTVTATVLGVGKFFMTVPATSTSIYAEFGGVVSDQALASTIVLFP